MPKDATIRGDGFRIYQWVGGDTEVNRQYGAVEPADLLSVTSIRTLAGEPYQLVAWKIANVVNLAMGVRKATRIGPRGGVKEVYVKDGPFPGEFVTRMVESRGDQAKLDETRSWLRATADEPRDVAAVRGSVVHKLIEMNVPMSMVDDDMVRNRITMQWKEERRKVYPDVTEDDIRFVTNAMAQYWDMRANVPFVIISQEPQVFNLKAGYGGSADVILWFLGTFEGDVFVPLPDQDVAKWQKAADSGLLTLADIQKVGGVLCVGDWKTSKGVYTGHVVQTTAYMAGEFVAYDGVIDTRLSDILAATTLGMVIHIRPNGWAVDMFEFRQDVLRAFLGSVAFARFLAMHKDVTGLFIKTVTGKAEGTDESEVIDDAE